MPPGPPDIINSAVEVSASGSSVAANAVSEGVCGGPRAPGSRMREGWEEIRPKSEVRSAVGAAVRKFGRAAFRSGPHIREKDSGTVAVRTI